MCLSFPEVSAASCVVFSKKTSQSSIGFRLAVAVGFSVAAATGMMPWARSQRRNTGLGGS